MHSRTVQCQLSAYIAIIYTVDDDDDDDDDSFDAHFICLYLMRLLALKARKFLCAVQCGASEGGWL